MNFKTLSMPKQLEGPGFSAVRCHTLHTFRKLVWSSDLDQIIQNLIWKFYNKQI